MKRMSKRIKEGFEAVTPNILPSILADCEEVKAEVVPVPVKKAVPFILRFVASAAVLALLVGVGALAGGLFRRPSSLAPSTDETQLPTHSAEDVQFLTAFCEIAGLNYEEIKDYAIIRHYWDLGDLHFFYVDNLSDYSEKMNSVRFLNKEFIFGTEQHLYMYKNGVCVDFMDSDQNTAFEVLTNDFLNAFYHFHKAENEALYDPSNWPAKTDLDCPAHLTAAKRVELEAALGITAFNTDEQWYSNKRPFGYRYYGTYEGYDIVFQATQLTAATTKAIAGQAFTHSSSFILYAHKDGNLLMLSDVYEDGLISKESIVAAREYHNQCTLSGMISTCRPHPIDKEHEEYIQQFWEQISDDPFGTWYSEDNTSGDWRVYPGYILFYTGGEQEEVFTTLQVGSYSFSHPTTFQMYVYVRWGPGLVEIKEYYSQYGEDNYLAEAAAMHMETQNAIFGEDWMPECDHNYESSVLMKPTCYSEGNEIYNCTKCGHCYTTVLPMLEHEWYAEDCGTTPVCYVCGEKGTQAVHTNKTDIRTIAPNRALAGVEEYTCADCGNRYHKLYGNTGEYQLETLTYEISRYAQRYGFTYRTEYPRTPYTEYEYTELYSVVESLGGHQILREKAYELIDKLYDDANNSAVGNTEPYELWFTVEYLLDNDSSVGAFRIHAFIAN